MRTLRPPRVTSDFFGCFDWHSAVHSYWQVLCAVHLYPNASFVPDAVALFNRNFTVDNVAEEMVYLAKRSSFEMPYGYGMDVTTRS